MALNSLGLGFIFTAKDLASGVLRKVERNFSKMDTTTTAAAASFGKNVGKVVGGLGLMAAGSIGLKAAIGSAGEFGKFDGALAKLQGRLNRTKEDMERLSARAIQAGIDTEFSPVEAVQGLEELGARGLDATDSMTALAGALDMAAAGRISVAQAASTMSAAMNVFKKDASEATSISDKLLKVTSLTGLAAGDMEEVFGGLSRGVSLTNQNFEEMLVLTGLVKNTGVPATVAASSISAALIGVSKNGKAFRELGVEVTDSMRKFRPLADIMLETGKVMSEKYPDAADRAKASLEHFTRFGLTAFAGVINQVDTGLKDVNGNIVKGADAVAAYIDRVKDSEGFGLAAREAKANTLPGQLDLLRGSVATLMIEIGKPFNDVFIPALKAVRAAVNGLIKVVANMPEGLKRAIAVGILLASVLTMVAGTAIAGAGAAALLRTEFIAWRGPIMAVVRVLGLASGAGAVLAATFVLLKYAFDKNIGGFGDKVTAIFAKVKLFFDAVQQLTSGDGKLRGNVLAAIIDPTNRGVLSLVQRFQQLRFRISKFVSGIKEGFSSAMKEASPAFAALGDALTQLFAALGFGSQGLELFTDKSKTWSDSGESVGEIIGTLAHLLVNGLVVAVRVATGMIEGAKVAFDLLWPAVKFVLGFFEAIVGVLTWVVDLFNDTTTEVSGTGSEVAHLSKMIGFGISAFYGIRAAAMLASVGMATYRTITGASTAAQAAFNTVTKAASIPILGPAGLVAAAFAVGYAVGTWIDKLSGASDAIANWLLDITGATEALNGLDKAYRNTIKKREAPSTFSSIEAAAGARNMTPRMFIEERSQELVRSETAVRLGLSQGDIANRLKAGEDVFTGVKLSAPSAAATGGITAKADGEANKAKAQQRSTADAVEAGIIKATKSNSSVKFQANFNVDGQTMAKIAKDAERAAAASSFEADLNIAGGY